MRYELFTEIVYFSAHTTCKNNNYLSTHENDMILYAKNTNKHAQHKQHNNL